jgi:hypothetical protein
MALNNLRSEVIELRNEGLEKDKILHSLVNKIKEDEATSKAQVEAQKREIEDFRKQLAEAKEKCAIAETKREISEQWANHLEKNIEELRASKERCYEKSIECVKGDPEGPIEWTSYEAEAFEEVLNGRGEYVPFRVLGGLPLFWRAEAAIM